MKLSKAQIEAIASKLAQEINANNRKKTDEEIQALKDKFAKTKEGKIYAAYHDLFSYNNVTGKPAMPLPWANYPTKNISSYNIFNDIQLATIEATGLEEIMAKIKKQYSL